MTSAAKRPLPNSSGVLRDFTVEGSMQSGTAYRGRRYEQCAIWLTDPYRSTQNNFIYVDMVEFGRGQVFHLDTNSFGGPRRGIEVQIDGRGAKR